VSDVLRYLQIVRGTRLLSRFLGGGGKGPDATDRAGLFDDMLGADIFLLGRKRTR